MLTLIHGDDTARSRMALQEEKLKYTGSEVIVLNGGQISISELTLATESNSLFSTPKLIIIENILKENQMHTIIIWEDRKIEAGPIKKYFSKAKLMSFDFPAQLFKFLDSISPHNEKNLLYSYHDLLKKEAAELIFVMLLRQFRYMLMAKDLKGEVAELPSWQAQKLYRQASFFTLENLISLYRQLISIDYRIKTGQTPLPLSKLLDLFFISL